MRASPRRQPGRHRVLASLTLGGWLVWDLIRNGGTLLAETMVDADIVSSRVEFATTIAHGDWHSRALGFTAFYFAGLAVAAAIIAGTIRYLPVFFSAQ